MERAERDRLLRLPDAELLTLCRTDRFRGTGPGGQKRNKTESAVRVTHLATGISAASDETRSQTTNRLLALRRLRREIAGQCRAQPPATPETTPCPSLRDPLYPCWLAAVLDALEAHEGRVSDAAARLGTSTGRLVRDLANDSQLWQQANACRRRFGLAPLRMPA